MIFQKSRRCDLQCSGNELVENNMKTFVNVTFLACLPLMEVSWISVGFLMLGTELDLRSNLCPLCCHLYIRLGSYLLFSISLDDTWEYNYII